MEQTEHLVEYIKQCLAQGMPEANIKEQLMKSGWSSLVIDNAFRSSQASYTSTQQYSQTQKQIPNNTHRIRNGVLWIISPFILIIVDIIIQFAARSANINSPFLNLLAILGGLGFFILIPLGFIRGIKILSSH